MDKRHYGRCAELNSVIYAKNKRRRARRLFVFKVALSTRPLSDRLWAWAPGRSRT